jgi:hypothetical protein
MTLSQWEAYLHAAQDHPLPKSGDRVVAEALTEGVVATDHTGATPRDRYFLKLATHGDVVIVAMRAKEQAVREAKRLVGEHAKNPNAHGLGQVRDNINDLNEFERFVRENGLAMVAGVAFLLLLAFAIGGLIAKAQDRD